MFILTKLSITSHYDDFLTSEIISFELFLKIWENKKKGLCIIASILIEETASILIEETNPYFICSV